MKFRKRPLLVDAVQFHSKDQTQVWPVCSYKPYLCDEKAPHLHPHSTDAARLNDGDWIVTGIEGETYPVKDSVFAATYEPVEEGT